MIVDLPRTGSLLAEKNVELKGTERPGGENAEMGVTPIEFSTRASPVLVTMPMLIPGRQMTGPSGATL